MFNIGDKVKIVRPLLYSQKLRKNIVGVVADSWVMSWCGEWCEYVRIQYEKESDLSFDLVVPADRCEKC